MKKLNDEDIQAYFQAGNSGFWKVESEEGKKTRLYTDEITNELFGTPEDMSPEKCMEYVAEHIYPQERECFWDYMEELKSHESEAVYRYMHPEKGVIYIRCTGRRVPSPDNIIRLVGYHQEAGDIVHFEKEKLLENRLLQQNLQLKDKNKNQFFYYKELLNTISVGVLSYTLPEHEIVHMNAEAMRIYGVETFEEAQENLGRLIGAVSYLSQNVIEKLMDMRYHDGAVSYECIIPDRKGHLTPAIAKTEIFYTSDGKKTILTTFLDISENVTLKKSLKEAQESNAVYTKELYQQLAAELNATFQQEQKTMHQQMQSMAESQGQYMLSADQVMQESQRIMKEQQNAYKQIMDYMKEAEQTSAKFWVACNQTMQKYVNAAASGLEGFTMSQKYNEQIFEANRRLIENYSEKVDEYMAAQKEVSAALEQIKRVFEDLAVSRDDKNIYLHRGNLQNISSNRELVQQMENMLKEEQENQRETMQEMSEWVQELAKNGGKANAKFGFFKNKNDR